MRLLLFTLSPDSSPFLGGGVSVAIQCYYNMLSFIDMVSSTLILRYLINGWTVVYCQLFYWYFCCLCFKTGGKALIYRYVHTLVTSQLPININYSLFTINFWGEINNKISVGVDYKAWIYLNQCEMPERETRTVTEPVFPFFFLSSPPIWLFIALYVSVSLCQCVGEEIWVDSRTVYIGHKEPPPGAEAYIPQRYPDNRIVSSKVSQPRPF